MATAFDGIQNLGQDNVQGVMKTFGAVAKGFQTAASEMIDYNKAAIERSAAFLQDLTRASSFGEALQIQTNYVKSSYDDFATEIGKLGGLWKEIALEATRIPDRAAGKSKLQ
jgi:hypothetical protein